MRAVEDTVDAVENSGDEEGDDNSNEGNEPDPSTSTNTPSSVKRKENEVCSIFKKDLGTRLGCI
jgi:hypothetical protein